VNPLPRNPYIAGMPISDPEKFFGREEIFRDVMNMLRSPSENAIVLHGQRRIGKTSVLLQIKRRLAESGEYTPIFFDLMNKASKPLEEVLYELAVNIAAETRQPEPEHAKFDADGLYFRKVFVPVAAKAAAPGGLVLLFEEFDVLDIRRETTANQAGQAFFPYLQTWMSDIQQVKFYFAIGRRPEDLSQEARHAFRGARYSHIGLLKRKDVEAVIRQSERDGSLTWTDGAVEKVWEWTQGHAFLTQLLCSVVWDNAYPVESIPATPPRVELADVDAAIADTLRRGENAFNWIWDGLPPAEKVVLAAIAEAKEIVITPERLTEMLKQFGVRLIIRELENAPDKLSEWGLLQPIDNGYRVVIPLLRHWVANNRPLRRAQDEVYKIDKIADRYFQLAQDEYKNNNLTQAERLLRNALERNDNHLNAMLLLGDVLSELDRTVEVVEILEKAYDLDPKRARADLIKTLLTLALKRVDQEPEQLEIYERVLTIDPELSIAQDLRHSIWKRRGEAALGEKRWDDARNAFKEAVDEDGVKKTDLQKHRHEYDTNRQKAEQHEQEKDWAAAVRTWEILVQDYSDVADCQAQLLEAKKQISFEKSYNEALEALQHGNLKIAANLLAWIIGQQADYKEAPRHLLRALDGLKESSDIAEYQSQLIEAKKQIALKKRSNWAEAIFRSLGLLWAAIRDIFFNAPQEGMATKEPALHERASEIAPEQPNALGERQATRGKQEEAYSKEQPRKEAPDNPFNIGQPARLDKFIGRKQELRLLLNRVAGGESIAIIGHPKMGKTSLLLKMLDEKAQQNQKFERDLFCYLHTQMLQEVKTFGDFWEKALAPLEERLQIGPPHASEALSEVYRKARANNFAPLQLDQLFTQMGVAGTRLMLMLDNFDRLLSHPVLNHADFYSMLRYLATISQGFVLVIACRLTIGQMDERTKHFILGSPYFNYFVERTVGAFAEPEVSELLDRAGDRFNPRDREFITVVSGGHPYLTQLAAAILWDILQDKSTWAEECYHRAAIELFHETERHFAETWRFLTEPCRIAMTAVALTQIPHLLAQPSLLEIRLLDDLADYAPDLAALEATGIVRHSDKEGWSITQTTLLWWLIDELRRILRGESSFNDWLDKEAGEGLLTSQGRETIRTATRKVLAALPKGAMTLIEAFVKGLGEEKAD